jgi:hypothetical protein
MTNVGCLIVAVIALGRYKVRGNDGESCFLFEHCVGQTMGHQLERNDHQGTWFKIRPREGLGIAMC